MALLLAIDQRIGRWTIIGARFRRSGNYYWPCRCQCGTERAIYDGDLKRQGRHGSQSCGCLMRELASLRKKHGMCDHPAYHSWKFARTRCRNPDNDMYHLYGGRGIKFSTCWDDFRVFWEEMGATWFEGATIDRFPNKDGDYESGNCRWATSKEQANNRRDNVPLHTDQEETTTTLAARAAGISPSTVFARRRYGWIEEDLLRPVRSHKPRKPIIFLETELGLLTIKQASEMTGISRHTIAQRVRAKWSKEDLFLPVRPLHRK